MKRKFHRSILLWSTVAFSHGLSAHGAIPLWQFTPLTATTVSLSPSQTATIRYTVTLNSHKSRLLLLTPITGVTQVTTAGNCANPISLATKGASCTLNLTVDGGQLSGNITGGPVVCVSGNPLMCYQPSTSSQLNITKVAASAPVTPTTADLTVSPTTLNLAAMGAPAFITVTNASSTVTVESLTATVPSQSFLFIDLSMSTCDDAALAPGASCNFEVMPASAESVVVTIDGTNATAAKTVNVTVARETDDEGSEY